MNVLCVIHYPFFGGPQNQALRLAAALTAQDVEGVKIIQTIGCLAPRYGGPAILVRQLARALSLRGHEVVLITTNADGAGVLATDQIASAEDAHYSTLACDRDWPGWYSTSRKMSAALDVHLRDADVLHIHGLYRFHTLESRRVCRRLGVPYVLSPHGALDGYQRGRQNDDPDRGEA